MVAHAEDHAIAHQHRPDHGVGLDIARGAEGEAGGEV
jgi:hypothetical protein